MTIVLYASLFIIVLWAVFELQAIYTLYKIAKLIEKEENEVKRVKMDYL